HTEEPQPLNCTAAGTPFKTYGVSTACHTIIQTKDLKPPAPGAPCGALVGTTGANPCVGMIVVTDTELYVYHFAAPDDACRVIHSHQAFWGTPKKIYCFSGNVPGGNGSYYSAATIDSITWMIPDDSTITWVESDGLWVDSQGNCYVFQND